MKKNLIPIASAVLTLAACQHSVIDPLEGIYPAPTVVELTSLVRSETSKADGIRYFTLELSGEGTTLYATLAGSAYYLTANVYTEAEEAAAKNGNFLLGKTSVNGTAVRSGSITITQEETAYTLKAVLFLSDGTPYKFSWAGQLTYEPDLEPVKLTEVLQASSNLANGLPSLTLKLGQAGQTADASGNITGDGNYLALDLYSADGYLHEGIYAASAAGDTIGEGEFGIGYDADFSAIGWGVFYNWGTCWWTISGTAATAEKITSGTITVARSGAGWTVTWGSEETYPAWAEFTGAIEALTGPAAE